MELYFIRHGSTDMNDQKRLRGWLNPPLNDVGKQQAELLAEYLKDEDVVKIYSSDFIRSSDTADIIAEAVGLPVETTDALRPINFGDFQGKPLIEIQKQLDHIMKQWQFDPNIKAPNGESFKSFQDRTYKFLTNVIDKADKDDCIFLVTHVRVCLLMAQIVINEFKPLKGKDLDRLDTIDVLPGNYLEIKQFDKGDIFRITGINQLDQDGIKSPVSEVISAAGT